MGCNSPRISAPASGPPREARGSARSEPKASGVRKDAKASEVRTEVNLNLFEIFSSIQGEGPSVGASTLFVRFGGCDLRCSWCDSPHTWKPAARCRIEQTRGEGDFAECANPLTLAQVLAAADALDVGSHRYVSLTGGEPLLQASDVAEVAEALRSRGPRVLLETHGVHAEALARVVAHIDVVSMDWKLASEVWREADAPCSGRSFDAEHDAFLAVARRAPEVVVKLVITPSSTDAELEEAWRRIAATYPGACVVLQPVTPMGGVKERVPAERLLALERRASALLADVRVIPQTHPIWGAR